MKTREVEQITAFEQNTLFLPFGLDEDYPGSVNFLFVLFGGNLIVRISCTSRVLGFSPIPAFNKTFFVKKINNNNNCIILFTRYQIEIYIITC